MGGVILFEKLAVLSAGQTTFGLSKLFFGNVNNTVQEIGSGGNSVYIGSYINTTRPTTISVTTTISLNEQINAVALITVKDTATVRLKSGNTNEQYTNGQVIFVANNTPNLFLNLTSDVSGINVHMFGLYVTFMNHILIFTAGARTTTMSSSEASFLSSTSTHSSTISIDTEFIILGI